MNPAARAPVLGPGQTYASATDQISALVLSQPTRRTWFLFFCACTVLALAYAYAITAVFTAGVGLMGINIPVAWGWPLVNVVWWIGIGHAGTLISAILLLFRQPWRTSINRFAEAMTIFAAGIAGMFPFIHLGRPWYFYFLLPYPNSMTLWPQWRSPLVWDFFAISTYITVSILFWYQGLIPDLATLRDRARSRRAQLAYGFLALGWRGSARHWKRYQALYLLLAGLATPLVVSVHSVISLDFTVTIVPGYHSTIFPPYFVAGALLSGFCMVITIAIPLRSAFRLESYITARHFDVMGKVMLASGMVVVYSYAAEFFTAWYSGEEFERYVIVNRAFGPYAFAFWLMMAGNVGLLQLLWSKRIRTSLPAMFTLALLINTAMWIERYVIVITSTHRDFMPSMWDTVDATAYDWALLLGSIGFFFFLMCLFIRFLPVISIHEVRELIHDRREPAP